MVEEQDGATDVISAGVAGGRLGRAWHWASEHRLQWHALCVLFLVVAACLLFYKNFTDPGMLMATDMTWPNSIARIQFKVVHTWSPYGSGPTFANPLWFYWIYPSSMFARLLRSSADNYMLTMFITTFSFAGISMYSLAYTTIRKLRLKDAAPYAPFLGAVVAALVYMYNPWSLHYFRPYFAFPTYAFLPLLFMLMVKTFDNPRSRNIIFFALLVSLVNTSYNLLWFWGMLFSYLVYYLLVNKASRIAMKRTAKALFGFISLYIILNAHWILPYLSARSAGKAVNPFYSPDLTQSMVQGLSNNSTMLNNFRMLSIWSWSIKQLPGGLLLEALTFAIPAFAILGLILSRREVARNRAVSYWTAMALVTLLLATGTRFILKGPYDYLVFRAPLSGSYGWMLRSSERWLFFVPIFLCLMLAILLCRLLSTRPTPATGQDRLARLEFGLASARYRRSVALAVVIAGLVLVSMYPKALEFADKVFNPTKVPRDYEEVQRFVGSKPPPRAREAWVPFLKPQLFSYEWAPEKRLTNYGALNSNPSLGSNYEIMNPNSYFNWLQDTFRANTLTPEMLREPNRMFDKDIMADLFIPFAARYIVLDKSPEGYDFGESFTTDTSISQVEKTNFLDVYKPDFEPGYLWAATRTLKARSFFDNLAFTQKLPRNEMHNLAFTDGRSYFGEVPEIPAKYGAVNLSDYVHVLNGNPGFELRDMNGDSLNWVESGHRPEAKITGDKKVKKSGDWCLKITNAATGKFELTWVVGDEVQVPEGSICAIEASVRYRNTSWTIAAAEGYLSDAGKWVQLAQCPTIRTGDSPWHTYYCSFRLPPGVTRLRPIVAAGWTRDPEKGKAVSWFDDVKLSVVEEGIYSEIATREAPPRIAFRQVNPEKCEVTVRGARSPFVLVHSEAFDSHWVAKTSSGQKITPVPMYGTINGFPIDQKGNFELTIENEPQLWLKVGLLVSLLTVLLCLVFLIYDWRRHTHAPAGRVASTLGLVGSKVRSCFDQIPRHRPGDGVPARAGQRKPRDHRQWVVARVASKVRSVIEEPPRRGRSK